MSLSDRLPAGVVVADPPDASNDCGGTLTAAAGGGTIELTDGELAANARCTIAVDVTSATTGSYPNATEAVTSSLGDSATAEATLTVDPAATPGFAKAFSPATVAPGGVSRLTFTIDNTVNLISVGGLGFRDFFPSGMVVADPTPMRQNDLFSRRHAGGNGERNRRRVFRRQRRGRANLHHCP